MPFTDIDGSGQPHLRLEQTSPKSFKVLQGFRYTLPRGKSGGPFEVGAGQETDLASVPFFLTWFIRSYGKYSLAAVLHDYLWRKRRGEVSLREANRVFRLAMYDLKVPFVRRWIMWAAVSLAALSKQGPVWKVRVVLWVVAVLALDLLAVWIAAAGSSPVALGSFGAAFAASMLMLWPNMPVSLMGTPTLFLLMPAILVILLTEAVYLAIDTVILGLGWVWRQAARALKREVPPKLNPLFIDQETLQRSQD